MDNVCCLLGVVSPVCGLIGYAIGTTKGQPLGGFLFGALLGPIGWVLTIATSDVRRKCKQCLGAVPAAAKRCKHCGEPL